MMKDFQFETNLESDVEGAVVAWAENNGWVPRPIEYRGRNGCPDVIFFGYGAIVVIEFKKRRGGRLSEQQKRERKRLKAVGVEVPVVNSVEQGIALLKSYHA